MLIHQFNVLYIVSCCADTAFSLIVAHEPNCLPKFPFRINNPIDKTKGRFPFQSYRTETYRISLFPMH